MIEQLTDGERAYIQAPPGVWNKALRIIDAQAEALKAPMTWALQQVAEEMQRHAADRARERDGNAAAWTVQWNRARAAEARVRELEALARKGDQAIQAAEAQVAELTQERDEARAEVDRLECSALRAEVERGRALLERALDEIDSDIHDDPVTIETVADIRAHLAAQPATAPARTEACEHGDNPCSDRDPFSEVQR